MDIENNAQDVKVKNEECSSGWFEDVKEDYYENIDIKKEKVEIFDEFLNENHTFKVEEINFPSETIPLKEEKDLIIEEEGRSVQDTDFRFENVKEENYGNIDIFKVEENNISPETKTLKEEKDSIIEEGRLVQDKKFICGRRFKREISKCGENRTISLGVTDHMNSFLLNQRQYECELCDFATSVKLSLRMHMDSVHVKNLKIKYHKCHLCDYSAAKGRVKQHINSVHSNSKQYKCVLCNFATNHKNSLKQHIKSIHSDIKEYKCVSCDYAANRKYSLKHHMDSVHLNLKVHKCNSCEFATHLKLSLKLHMETVHLNLKQYKCDSCDFATARKDSLKLHIENIHLKSKLHKCGFCDYVSNTKLGLKKHMNYVHLNLKSFK